MQLGVTQAPLCTPALAPLNKKDQKDKSAIRVLSILFDTHDDPDTYQKNFEEKLAQTKLSSIFSGPQLTHIRENYK